jgi:hypothetical protein
VSLLKNRKAQIFAGIIFGLVVLAVLIGLFAGGKQQTVTSTIGSVQNTTEGFTFFDLGAESRLTDSVQDRLQEKLGSDAVAKKTLLNLTINYKGFLLEYFKELYELNKRLNFPSGERVEHNIVKLMYRHAQKKKVPFEYVELIFSDYTQKPLMFKISSPKEGAFVVETIKQKYGQPQVIDWKWNQEKGRSLYWKKNKSVLILTVGRDRYGDPEYHTVIYYVENIEELLLTELKEAQQRELEIKKKAKTAF